MKTSRHFLQIALPAALLLFGCSAERQGDAATEALSSPASRGEWMLEMLADPTTGRVPEGMRRAELAFAATLPIHPEKQGRALLGGWSWESRGPWNIGGRTRGLGVDITGPDTILAGSVSGGIWRSSDGGASWQRATLPSQFPGLSSLVQERRPGRTHIWYAGTGEAIGTSASGGGAFFLGDGIYRSTDNGRSWEPLPSTISGTPQTFDRVTDVIWRVAVDPSRDSVLFAATYGSILRSTDAGGTWRGVLTASSTYFTDVTVSPRGVAYASFSSEEGRRGVWRSENGTSWTKVTTAEFPTNHRRVIIALADGDTAVERLYALAETPGSGFAGRDFRGDTIWTSLWRYTRRIADSGGVWEDLTGALPAFGGSFGDFNPQSSYNMALLVDGLDTGRVFVGGTNVYRTRNAFADRSALAWIGGYRNIPITNEVIVPLSYPEHHPDIHSLLFHPGDRRLLFSGSDGGVHVTDDADADSVIWRSLNEGYLTSQFYTVAIDPVTTGSELIVGGLQDNGTWSTASADPRAEWVQRGSGDGAWCAVAPGGREMLVSKQNGKSYRVLLDEAGEMTSFARIDPEQGRGYGFINPFAVDPEDFHLLYMPAGRYLWRNRDISEIPGGNLDSTAINWVRLDAATIPDTAARISAITAGVGHRLWYGTSRGRLYRLDRADTSTLAPLDVTGPFPSGAYVSSIALDPLDADRAMVLFSNYNVQSIFVTEDGGESWQAVAGNLEERSNGTGKGPSVRWGTILHRPGGTVYLVGTSVGLFATTELDSMRTVWEQEGAGSIGNLVVTMIAARPSDGRVVVGTHGGGVYAATIDRAVGVPVAVDAGRGGVVVEPNVVTGEATIAIDGELRRQAVRVTLHDRLGRRVAILTDLLRADGSLRFDLARFPGLPSGRYFVRVQGGDRAVTVPLQVLR